MPNSRSSPSEVFLGKGVLKLCRKFTGKHPCRSVISIKLLCNSIEITLRCGCSPVKLLHIFRTPSYKNASEGLLLRTRKSDLKIDRRAGKTDKFFLYCNWYVLLPKDFICTAVYSKVKIFCYLSFRLGDIMFLVVSLRKPNSPNPRALFKGRTQM